jgi:hypothetical protein
MAAYSWCFVIDSQQLFVAATLPTKYISSVAVAFPLSLGLQRLYSVSAPKFGGWLLQYHTESRPPLVRV